MTDPGRLKIYNGAGWSYVTTGPSGYSGWSGVSGYSGWSGASGTSGYSGWSGQSGYSGYAPGTGTDNRIVRWNGTTSLQDSAITIADTTGNMSGVGTLGCGAITSTGAIQGTSLILPGTINSTLTNDTNTGALRVTAGANGYGTFGPLNSSSLHIYTDRGSITFNKTIQTTSGDLGTTSYNFGNLYMNGALFMDNTSIIDTNKNMANIGTIGCGAITSSSTVKPRGGTIETAILPTSYYDSGKTATASAGSSNSYSANPSSGYVGFLPMSMSATASITSETNPGAVSLRVYFSDSTYVNVNTVTASGTVSATADEIIAAIGTNNGKSISSLTIYVSGGQTKSASFSAGVIRAWQF